MRHCWKISLWASIGIIFKNLLSSLSTFSIYLDPIYIEFSKVLRDRTPNYFIGKYSQVAGVAGCQFACQSWFHFWFKLSHSPLDRESCRLVFAKGMAADRITHPQRELINKLVKGPGHVELFLKGDEWCQSHFLFLEVWVMRCKKK